ncbi:MAG: hypothetical protein H6996_05275 [Moraxellaceae bacterium]|nr:hypothetical protein [Moraxellaceae bacterium]MCP5177217.1 hypothetical protein [Moraxellaceae bacterium]
MSKFTINAKGQTLTLSNEEALTLEKSLIEARQSPNQSVSHLINGGVMLVTFSNNQASTFSRSIKPTDVILSPIEKPFYSDSQVIATDC